jgi:SAM-dependent methyltransferase
MALFKNSHDSHQHSLEVLTKLVEYDSFLDSLTVVADMGCGAGLDSKWWAELTTRDEPPEPRNYIVYAVDQNTDQIESDVLKAKNVIPIQGNFENRIIPRQVDLMWAHDVFQYSRNPYKCLATWKQTLNLNGMLVLSIPQTTYWDKQYGKLVVSQHNHQYYSYNLLNLIYMLAVSGFDCRDAYFYRDPNSPWLYAAVYATVNDPMGDREVTWHELAEKRLINDSLLNSINKYGYVRLDDVVVMWLDKNFYQITN